MPKGERLNGEIRISRLFTEGEAFLSYPFRVVYSFCERTDEFPLKFMVSVSKKRFKRAIKRNRIKRLIREAYRLNKHPLYDVLHSMPFTLCVGFIYVSDDELDFSVIEKKMQVVMEKLLIIVRRKQTESNPNLSL
jgi:ribonuclease P protein component